MKEILLTDIDNLEDKLEKIYSVKHTSTNKFDALWKYAVCIDFIEKEGLSFGENAKIIDIGTADSYLFIYLMKLWRQSEFIGIDVSREYLKKVDVLVKNNKLEDVKYHYFINDYMVQSKIFGDNSIDFAYDNCSVIHFKTSSNLSYNDGLFITGKEIYRTLKPGGCFILSCDYNDSNEKGEFIKRDSLVSTLKQTGLTYLEQHSKYITHGKVNDLNNYMNVISKFNKINEYSRLINPRPHEYGVVFLVFQKIV